MASREENRIKELFQKYLEKDISREDFQELFSYIDDPKYKELFFELMTEQEGKVESEIQPNEIDWDTMLSQITQDKPTKKINFSFLKYVAAIVLPIVAFFVFNLVESKKQITNNSTLKIIQPLEKDKVYLTLEDGTQINLSQDHYGVLATQGKSELVKDKEGNLIYHQSSNEDFNKKNTLTTPVGKVFSLVLSDGTKVWLNSLSKITYPVAFNQQERKVELVGEAYFEVAKDAQRPFYVLNGKAEIKVLGTHFNVNAYPDESKSAVTLLEGSIMFIKDNNSLILKPGKQIQFSQNDTDEKLINANIDEVMAWKNNLFIFNQTKLTQILKDISRWYNVSVIYDGEIPEVSFTGVIPRNTTLLQALDNLELTGDIDFSVNGDVITVKKK